MAIITSAPPIQRLEHWTLVASDVERSKRFYIEVLGATAPEGRGGGGGGGGPTAVELAGTIIDLFAANERQQPSPGGHGQHHAYIIKLEDSTPGSNSSRSTKWPMSWGPTAWAGCRSGSTTRTDTTSSSPSLWTIANRAGGRSRSAACFAKAARLAHPRSP